MLFWQKIHFKNVRKFISKCERKHNNRPSYPKKWWQINIKCNSSIFFGFSTSYRRDFAFSLNIFYLDLFIMQVCSTLLSQISQPRFVMVATTQKQNCNSIKKKCILKTLHLRLCLLVRNNHHVFNFKNVCLANTNHEWESIQICTKRWKYISRSVSSIMS